MNILSSLFQTSSKKSVRDIEVPRSGLSRVLRLRSGEFGTRCSGSLPLQDFPIADDSMKEVIRRGKSTYPDHHAGRFLKASLDRPLSTCEVRSCSVVYLYNTQTFTHFLLHQHHEEDLRSLGERIQRLMSEGFDGAAIVLGSNRLYYHSRSVPYIFSELQASNPKAIVNVYHCMSLLPEIVCYRGRCFQIPTPEADERYCNNGQASFEIVDLFVSHIAYVSGDCVSPGTFEHHLQRCRDAYTPEIMAILKPAFDKREALIQEVFADDFVYTLTDCRQADYYKSDIMYRKLELQRLKEVEAIETKERLVAFLSQLREQILPASYGFERTHILGFYLKRLNALLFQKAKDFGLGKCKEADIIFDKEGFDKRMEDIWRWSRRGGLLYLFFVYTVG